MSGHHSQGFTLTEILIVIGILGVLAAALIMNLSAAQKAAKRKIFDTYAQTCVAAAQKKRDYVSNSVTLPDSCAALDVPPPAGVDSATITDNGTNYTITVTASQVGFNFSQNVAKQVTSP